MNSPAAHPREEEAAAYVFGHMEAVERIAFVKAMNEDAALRDLVQELSDTAAALALAAPQVPAPLAVRDKVLRRVTDLPQDGARQVPTPVSANARTTNARRSPSWMGWAAAAVLLLAGVFAWTDLAATKKELAGTQLELATTNAQLMELHRLSDQGRKVTEEAVDQIKKLMAKLSESDKNASELQNQLARSGESNNQLKQQLDKAVESSKALEQEMAQRTKAIDELKVELARATQDRDIAKMQVATLQSTVKEYKQGVAVVVWNSATQEGILKLEKMPPLDASKDYQLWVVDPTKDKPVDGGIVRVDPSGFAKVEFKPLGGVQQADKFALSVEKKGGVPEREGPIVLISP